MKRVQEKIEVIKKCKGDYKILHRELKRKRLKWFKENKDKLKLKGAPPRQAFEMLLFHYMKLSKEEVKVIHETKNKITWISSNFCPILEACQRLGLDTRVVCKEGAEQSVQDLISKIDPNLVFSRDYKNLRPYAKYCKETIELKKLN